MRTLYSVLLLLLVFAPSLCHGLDPLEAIRAVVDSPNDVNSLEEALEEIGALKDMLKSVIGGSEEEDSPSPPPQESVEVSAAGEQVVQCHTILNCEKCVASGCGWCLSSRACRLNEPWQCQGDEDHVGSIGLHHECPKITEDSEEGRKRAARRKRREEARRIIDELRENGGVKEGGKGGEGERRKDKREEQDHLDDLAERAKRAEENYGMKFPYETLSVGADATNGEIRKAYRQLSLLYHPDKNQGNPLAEAAFKDITAAYEIIGDPEKRVVFDDIGSMHGEAFTNQEDYERYGTKNTNNFYQGVRLITALTESLWEKRVGIKDDVWIVEFYAPWCGPCQQFVPLYKQIAEALQHDSGIEMGAVNCAAEANLCGSRFGIRAYPTVLAINDKWGTRQEFTGVKSLEEVVAWARDVAKEWHWLFKKSNIIPIESSQQFKDVVLNSTDFFIVAFLDGLDCSQCMTAKTNLMRLSAGLRGYDNVSIALVDCDSSSARQLCYEEQQIPAAPHAPVVKGYQSGEKYAGTVGEALYNSNEMEPHLALEIMERLVRLILSDRIKSSSALSDGTLSGFEKNRKEEEEKEKDHNPPPRKMWNGPPPRGPLPWGGGGGGMSRTALGH